LEAAPGAEVVPCHGILLKKDEEKIYRNSGAKRGQL